MVWLAGALGVVLFSFALVALAITYAFKGD